MSRWLMNDEIEALNALGVTTAEVEARLGSSIVIDGSDVWANGRRGEHAVERLLCEARQRADDRRRQTELAAGRLVEWRKVGGTWVLAGKDLCEGDIVTVTRRDGTTSEEVVGPLIGVRDGLTLAKVGRI